MVDSWSDSKMLILHWFLHGFWSLDSGSDSKMLILHWFLYGFWKFGVILGLSGPSRSQLGSSEGPLGII